MPARLHRIAVAALLIAASHLVSHQAIARPMSRAAAKARAEALATLGQQLFADPRLSASGQLACASCHSPAHEFGPPNALPVQLGGPDMHQPGVRAVPSLKYLQAVPQFTEHYFDSPDEADESIDNGPTGGLTWDGRVDTPHAQAPLPLLSPFEMANHSASDVVARADAAGYAATLVALDTDGAGAFATLLAALEAYQQGWQTFYPYSSKYDAYLAGRTKLSFEESRGLVLFEDRNKGNCASCHLSERADDGEPPQFTDFGLIAIGVPRNPEIPANADPQYFDLGLCGPLRTDFANRKEYCGLFRTPSLRNVATRHTFFHNGVFHSLRDAVAFYASRDTDPGRWYPKHADGTVAIFDDLPPVYRDNLNRDPPFGGHPGEPPALN
ncbi:MAG: cytochrome-c peroxidase, partial [Acetobacteraceae bacterium]